MDINTNVVIPMVFLQAIEGVLSIVIMITVGYFLARLGWFNRENSGLLPKLVNYVSLPAYMLWNLMTTFNHEQLVHLLYGVIVPIISMLVCFVIGLAVSKLLNLAPKRQGVFRAAFFSSSAVFVGVPVNLALFGESSIPYVLLYFLANALLFWTFGNYSISISGDTAPPKIISLDTIKNVCSPPFMGFVTATALILLGIKLPGFIISTAKYLGGMTTPLSLLFIGVIMFGINLRNVKLSKDIVAVLIGRFVISPLAVVFVASYFPIPELMKKVFVIQASLPAMTQTTILANVYHADTEYAAMLVSLTNLLAMIAIPVYMVLM